MMMMMVGVTAGLVPGAATRAALALALRRSLWQDSPQFDGGVTADRVYDTPLQIACMSDLNEHGGMALKIRSYLLVLGFLSVAFAVYGQEEGETEAEAEAAPTVEPLVEAVTTGQLREVRRLLGDGVDTNVATESGTPVITYASLHGLENVAKALIDEQADLNAQNRAGATALMYAAQFQHNGIVDALIEGGADVNAQDSVGWTPLIYAVVGANAAAVTALVEVGADVNATGLFGRTAAQIAEIRGNAEVLEALSPPSGS